MKRWTFVSVLLLTASFLISCTSARPGHTLMTYNIRHGVGLDGKLDLERTARVIRSTNPDIVILNEVDHSTLRSFGVEQADSLGSLLQMDARFGRSIDYDGGQYGNALLTRYPIISFEIIDLSTDSLLEGRSVFIAHLGVENDTMVIMGTHLGLKIEERVAQVTRILQALPNQHKLILAGDFNFEPESVTYHLLMQRLKDTHHPSEGGPRFTFPANAPKRRIDYIFIGSGIQLLNDTQVDHDELQIASDHRPLTIRFK